MWFDYYGVRDVVKGQSPCFVVQEYSYPRRWRCFYVGMYIIVPESETELPSFLPMWLQCKSPERQSSGWAVSGSRVRSVLSDTKHRIKDDEIALHPYIPTNHTPTCTYQIIHQHKLIHKSYSLILPVNTYSRPRY